MRQLKKQFIETIRFLNNIKVEYAVLGGVAVSFYGEPRFTADIDVNIMLEKSDITFFVKEAKKYGYTPACPNIRAFVKKTGVIPMKFQKKGITGECDFIIAENMLEKAALKRVKIKKVGPFKARLISPEDLIIQKLISSRAKDIEDAKGIIERQHGRLDVKYIEGWLDRIGRIAKENNPKRLFAHLMAGR